MPYKAIIFDFDGVLVLSEQPRFNIIKASARKVGVDISENCFANMVGKTTVSFLRETMPQDKHFLIDEIVRLYQSSYKNNIVQYVEPIPLMVEFIRHYDGPIKLALASMSDRNVIEQVLRHYNIYEKFATIITKQDVKSHKPDPEVYIRAMQALCVTPQDCVVIEDTLVGFRAASAASIDCYIFLNGSNSRIKHSPHIQMHKPKGFISTRKHLKDIILSAN